MHLLATATMSSHSSIGSMQVVLQKVWSHTQAGSHESKQRAERKYHAAELVKDADVMHWIDICITMSPPKIWFGRTKTPERA